MKTYRIEFQNGLTDIVNMPDEFDLIGKFLEIAPGKIELITIRSGDAPMMTFRTDQVTCITVASA